MLRALPAGPCTLIQTESPELESVAADSTQLSELRPQGQQQMVQRAPLRVTGELRRTESPELEAVDYS